MRAIAGYLIRFWKKDFHWPTYGLTALLLIILISFNYAFDFEDSILDKAIFGNVLSWPVYFLYFAIPYFSVIGIYLLTNKEGKQLFTTKFWFKSLFALALVSFKVHFFYHHWAFERIDVIGIDLNFTQRYAYARILNRLVNLVIYTAGIYGFYKFFETENKTNYGFKSKGFHYWPYVVMLLIMVPLIAWASTQADFQAVYPKLRPEYLGDQYWKYFAVYEPLYMGEFVMVEWFFRGFLVVGMIRLIGPKAILPMVVLYAVFHFGKPLGECIGSIFGGYILGVIAYYSRSIWGGIIVHMGVAFLMDIGALAAKMWF